MKPAPRARQPTCVQPRLLRRTARPGARTRLASGSCLPAYTRPALASVPTLGACLVGPGPAGLGTTCSRHTRRPTTTPHQDRACKDPGRPLPPVRPCGLCGRGAHSIRQAAKPLHICVAVARPWPFDCHIAWQRDHKSSAAPTSNGIAVVSSHRRTRFLSGRAPGTVSMSNMGWAAGLGRQHGAEEAGARKRRHWPGAIWPRLWPRIPPPSSHSTMTTPSPAASVQIAPRHNAPPVQHRTGAALLAKHGR